MLRVSIRMQSKKVSILFAQFSSVFVRPVSLPTRKQPQPPHLRLELTTTSFHQSSHSCIAARQPRHLRWGTGLLGEKSQGSNILRRLETLVLREDPASNFGRASHPRVYFASGPTFGDPVAPRLGEVAPLYSYGPPRDLSSGGMGDAESELVLNRDDFTREFRVVAVKVPAKRTSELQGRLRKELLNMPHRKNVERCPGEDYSSRLLLLNTSVKDHQTLEGLSADSAAFLKGDDALSTTTFEVRIGYSDLGVEEVLTRLLSPLLPGREITTSFEAAGHLAHLNLKDHLLPYKKIIGQVIIDKNPRITTVVNKVDTISTRFRTFPMELIAGEPNTEVELKESGCTFRFDFAKVYWNSRLQGEHARLIKIIQNSGKDKVVCDMMAGVGPFAVPLAKAGHQVYANDLNPESFRALRRNGLNNKVKGRLTSTNECGREFARRLIREGKVFHHAILNLPDSALSFLDVFGDVDWKARGFETPPCVHVYCFSRAADPKQDALDRANEAMRSSLTSDDVKIHIVRDVAPNKPMLCLSFVAPNAAPPPLSSMSSSPGIKGAPSSSAVCMETTVPRAASTANTPDEKSAAAVEGSVCEGGVRPGTDGVEARLPEDGGSVMVGCRVGRSDRPGGEELSREDDCKRLRTNGGGVS